MVAGKSAKLHPGLGGMPAMVVFDLGPRENGSMTWGRFRGSSWRAPGRKIVVLSLELELMVLGHKPAWTGTPGAEAQGQRWCGSAQGQGRR